MWSSPKGSKIMQLPVYTKKSMTGTRSAKVVSEKDFFFFFFFFFEGRLVKGGRWGGGRGLKFQSKDFLIWQFSKSGNPQ